MGKITSKAEMELTSICVVNNLVTQCSELINHELERHKKQLSIDGQSRSITVNLAPLRGRFGDVIDEVFGYLKKMYKAKGWNLSLENVSNGRWVSHWAVSLQ